MLKSAHQRRSTALAQLLTRIREITLDGPAARETARLRVDLEHRGLTIGPFDLLIAGTALSRGTVLVTANIAEFRRVAGLRLEDWSARQGRL